MHSAMHSRWFPELDEGATFEQINFSNIIIIIIIVVMKVVSALNEVDCGLSGSFLINRQ